MSSLLHTASLRKPHYAASAFRFPTELRSLQVGGYVRGNFGLRACFENPGPKSKKVTFQQTSANSRAELVSARDRKSGPAGIEFGSLRDEAHNVCRHQCALRIQCVAEIGGHHG